MTISAQNNRISYSGNGSTTAFSYPAKFLANADLVVILKSSAGVETTKTLTTHYTVTGAGDAGGGTVTMVTAPASGETLIIYNDPTITQAVDLVEGDALAVETQVEVPLDRLTLIARRLADRTTRALRASEGANAAFDGVINPTGKAGYYLRINAAETGFEAAVGDANTSTFTNTGSGAVERSVTVKLSETVSAEDFGAVGDGSTDDTIALNTALALGCRVWLRRNATYKVTSRLVFVSGSALLGDGTPKIYAPAASFSNASIDIADRYASDSSVISVQGLLSSPYTAIDNCEVDGIIVESEVSDGRAVDAIVARNGTNIRITNNTIFGFPVGCGVRAASLLQDSKINGNHIHTFADDTDWGAGSPQITGIEIDNDIVNSVHSDGLEIVGNRIHDLTVGATFLAAHGYETDGINIAKQSVVNCSVRGNRINNVGEGIDCFGSYNAITGNVTDDCYIFGIKLIHGASFNAITGNVIRRSGLAGVALEGSNSATQDTKGNVITSNTIRDIDHDGAWSSGTTGCIRTSGSGQTYKVRDNVISDNVLDPGSTGDYAIVLQSDGTNNAYRDNRIVAAGTSGRFSITGSETYNISDAVKTCVRVARVSAVQSIPDNTATKIEFDSEGVDSRGEYDNTTNYRWTCQIPGPYRVYSQARFGTMSDGVLVVMEVRKSGNSMAAFGMRGGGANDGCYSVSDVVNCAAGDYIEIFVTQVSGGGTARDITNNAARTFMTIDPA